MTQTEAALGDASDLLQQAREALVAAGNASYTDAERQLARRTSCATIRAQLLAVANRDDGAGSYLFGGQGSSAAAVRRRARRRALRRHGGPDGGRRRRRLPLDDRRRPPGSTARTGNGVFETRAGTATGSAWIDTGRVTHPALSPARPTASQFAVAGGATTYSVLEGRRGDGADATSPTRRGRRSRSTAMSATITGQPANGDRFELRPSTPTLSVFDALDRAATELETPGRSGGQVLQTTATSLRDIDAVLGSLQAARSRAATR